MKYTDEQYDKMIEELFGRVQSFQNVGAAAYKPGIDGIRFMDDLLGHPHRSYRCIHVAGTNGKGSVSNMLASVLAGQGLKVGLYTSPHILDFRERARVITDQGYSLISKEFVWDFINKWGETFDHIGLSFFEITTALAFDWFAAEKVDIAVIETGLGGRLDSTNIISPILSVITNIGLDHCDLLGDTLGEIAFEKAGIIKENIPVVVGESNPETDSIFERKVLYSNMSQSSDFFTDRSRALGLLSFADKTYTELWDDNKAILASMDLKGEYQKKNLRTALVALDKLSGIVDIDKDKIVPAICRTASRTGFHGRWEKIQDSPLVICDIGHNEHGLKHNFAQLEKMRRDCGAAGEGCDGSAAGGERKLIIVYGSVADKDVDAVVHLMPANATYIFTKASGKRALPSEIIKEKFLKHHSSPENCTNGCEVLCTDSIKEAVGLALELANKNDIIYIGGSTYVVSEASAIFLKNL